jgi:hypothetical protein
MIRGVSRRFNMNTPKTRDSATSQKNAPSVNLKKSVITAILLFIVPLCTALLMAVVIKGISPVHSNIRRGVEAERTRTTNAPALPPEQATIKTLLSYRAKLRQRGDPTEFVNMLIWRRAVEQPVILFTIPSPFDNLQKWCVTQNGSHALAIKADEEDPLFKNVALYSITSGAWIWKKRLPWPDEFEAPWIFGGNLVIRSSKNGYHFAMELDEYGCIVALDRLADSDGFTPPADTKHTASIPGEFVAQHHKVIFIRNAADELMAYSSGGNLPGLQPVKGVHFNPEGSISMPAVNRTISGNALLTVYAENGKITIADSFTGRVLEEVEAWRATDYTVVRGLTANFNASEIVVHLRSTFNLQGLVERDWQVRYKPDQEQLEIETGKLSIWNPRRPILQTEIADYGLVIEAEGTTLKLAYTNKIEDQSVIVDLAESTGESSDIKHIELLANRRHLLIEHTDNTCQLLDLHAVRHYGDLTAKIRHCDQILAESSYAELKRTNLVNKDMRELPENLRDPLSEDNFNYAMLDYYIDYIDPRKLEPPALPSILSLQAEFLAAHRAWHYAARKLEQLSILQEHDHRAPKANQLLFTRYCILSGEEKKAEEGAERGLNHLFYDYTSFNSMIRWQFLKILFPQQN